MKYNYAFRTIRSTKQLTQKELADFANVSAGYISKIEKGEKVPTLEVIEKICEGTNIPFPVFALLSSEAKPAALKYESELNTIKRSLMELLPDGTKEAKT